MNRIWGIVVLVGTLALAGCSGSGAEASAPTPTPTPTVNPNRAACDAVATATGHMSAALRDSSNYGGWDGIRAEFDTAALKAEGDVKRRISALVDDWPKVASIVVYVDGRKSFNSSLEDIGRACAASGASIDKTMRTFVTE